MSPRMTGTGKVAGMRAWRSLVTLELTRLKLESMPSKHRGLLVRKEGFTPFT